MTNDDGRKPEGAPERCLKTGPQYRGNRCCSRLSLTGVPATTRASSVPPSTEGGMADRQLDVRDDLAGTGLVPAPVDTAPINVQIVLAGTTRLDNEPNVGGKAGAGKSHPASHLPRAAFVAVTSEGLDRGAMPWHIF